MKAALKIIANGCSRIIVLPLVGLVKALELFLKTDQPFQLGSHTVSLIPGIVGNYLRKEFYRMTLARCGADVCIEFGTIIHQSSVELGRRVYIGCRCSIGACVIEDDAVIGSNVDIISGRNQHNIGDLDTPIHEQGGRLEKIVIGADTWIGNSAVVMASVGVKSVVGAGSVVVEAVESRAVVAGNPARLLRIRKDLVAV